MSKLNQNLEIPKWGSRLHECQLTTESPERGVLDVGGKMEMGVEVVKKLAIFILEFFKNLPKRLMFCIVLFSRHPAPPP